MAQSEFDIAPHSTDLTVKAGFRETTRPASCPTCASVSRHLMDWEFSGLGDSIFNYVARYHCCDACGLVYIDNIDDGKLARFYSEECAYFDQPHFDITSPANIEKYAAYKSFVVSHGLGGVRVADIGCGRGGFLSWLKSSGWDAECCGVDVDVKSIPVSARGESEIDFQCGGVHDLPLADGTQSLLTYFHVFEHIRDIDRLLDEAFRVLEPGGHILIEVPDAQNYDRHPIGSGFWLAIREHIYHFSVRSLIAALHRHGLSVVDVARQVLPTPEFAYPSLMILGRKHPKQSRPTEFPPGDIASFALESKQALRRQADEIAAISPRGEKVTFWGCSAGLMSILPLLDLPQATLCDSSKLKQQSRYRMRAIREPKDIRPEGLLVIAPYLHGAAIERAALQLGWRQEAIHRLK